MNKIIKQIINFVSPDEWLVFTMSVYVGYELKILFGVILSILYLWLKLKYYEGKILNAYQDIGDIEQKILSNPELPKGLSERRINHDSRPYYLKIERGFEIKRKFLIDKLAIVTFIGLLLIDKL